MTENDDWYFIDAHENAEHFDRALYEDLMSSQGVRIDKHGDPLEWTDRTVAVKHTATMAAKTCIARGRPSQTAQDAMNQFADKAGEIVRKINGDYPPQREFDPDVEGLVEIEVSDFDELTRLFWEWRALRFMGH